MISPPGLFDVPPETSSRPDPTADWKRPQGEPRFNHLCAGYKKFFPHLDSPMRTMGALLSMGRPPADIMTLPRAQWLPPARPPAGH